MDRTVVISGASRGIGLELVKEFSKGGYKFNHRFSKNYFSFSTPRLGEFRYGRTKCPIKAI